MRLKLSEHLKGLAKRDWKKRNNVARPSWIKYLRDLRKHQADYAIRLPKKATEKKPKKEILFPYITEVNLLMVRNLTVHSNAINPWNLLSESGKLSKAGTKVYNCCR